MTNLVNFLLYQAGWFACVVGAANGFPWLGAGIAMVLVALHGIIAKDPRTQFTIMLAAAGLGLLVDTLLLNMGATEFHEGMVVAWLPPLWMTVLWIQFATTFRYCLHWLGKSWILSSFFGLIGAPIAFLVGERLGAIDFPSPRLVHFSLLAMLWSIAMPTLFEISTRVAERNGEKAGYRWPRIDETTG